MSFLKAVKGAANAAMGITEPIAKVREATNNEKWGPSSTIMGELAEMTFRSEPYKEVIEELFKRINTSNGKQWRHVYKSLTVLEYLMRLGSERVIDDCRSRVYELRTLKHFEHVDEDGKDQGQNVRIKSKNLVDMLMDDRRLRDEREKARANKSKFTAISSSDRYGASAGGFGSGGGSGNTGRFGGMSSADYFSGGGGGGHFSDKPRSPRRDSRDRDHHRRRDSRDRDHHNSRRDSRDRDYDRRERRRSPSPRRRSPSPRRTRAPSKESNGPKLNVQIRSSAPATTTAAAVPPPAVAAADPFADFNPRAAPAAPAATGGFAVDFGAAPAAVQPAPAVAADPFGDFNPRAGAAPPVAAVAAPAAAGWDNAFGAAGAQAPAAVQPPVQPAVSDAPLMPSPSMGTSAANADAFDFGGFAGATPKVDDAKAKERWGDVSGLVNLGSLNAAPEKKPAAQSGGMGGGGAQPMSAAASQALRALSRAPTATSAPPPMAMGGMGMMNNGGMMPQQGGMMNTGGMMPQQGGMMMNNGMMNPQQQQQMMMQGQQGMMMGQQGGMMNNGMGGMQNGMQRF